MDFPRLKCSVVRREGASQRKGTLQDGHSWNAFASFLCKPHLNVPVELSRGSRSCSPGPGAQPGSGRERLRCCLGPFGPTKALQLPLCSLSSGLLAQGQFQFLFQCRGLGAPWAASASSQPWLCLGMSPVLGWALAQPLRCSLAVPAAFPVQPSQPWSLCSSWAVRASICTKSWVIHCFGIVSEPEGPSWNASNFCNKLMGGSYKSPGKGSTSNSWKNWSVNFLC